MFGYFPYEEAGTAFGPTCDKIIFLSFSVGTDRQKYCWITAEGELEDCATIVARRVDCEAFVVARVTPITPNELKVLACLLEMVGKF